MSTAAEDDGEVDVDAAWARIVANWDVAEEDLDEQTPAAGEGRPRREGPLSWDEMRARLERDEPDEPIEPIEPAQAGAQASASPVPPADGSRPLGPRDVAPDGPSLLDGLDAEDEEGYVPPEPPPLPRPGLITALAWLGAVGAPFLLILCALFWRTAPQLVIGLAVLGFISGFVTLIVRMPERSSDDDDGAVV